MSVALCSSVLSFVSVPGWKIWMYRDWGEGVLFVVVVVGIWCDFHSHVLIVLRRAATQSATNAGGRVVSVEAEDVSGHMFRTHKLGREKTNGATHVFPRVLTPIHCVFRSHVGYCTHAWVMRCAHGRRTQGGPLAKRRTRHAHARMTEGREWVRGGRAERRKHSRQP